MQYSLRAPSVGARTPLKDLLRRRIRAALQQPRQMRRIAGLGPDRAGQRLGRFLQVDVVGLVHRLADPVAGTAAGDGETNVGERLVELRGDVMRTVLV